MFRLLVLQGGSTEFSIIINKQGGETQVYLSWIDVDAKGACKAPAIILFRSESVQSRRRELFVHILFTCVCFCEQGTHPCLFQRTWGLTTMSPP